MANDDYFSEGKYRCNHPESDFEDNSKGPIEMKKENFVEYTHRNETANYRYDIWNDKNREISKKFYSDSYSETKVFPQNNMTNSYSGSSYSRNSYSGNSYFGNSYNKKTIKKSSNVALIILIIFWGIPFIFEILGAIFELHEGLL